MHTAKLSAAVPILCCPSGIALQALYEKHTHTRTKHTIKVNNHDQVCKRGAGWAVQAPINFAAAVPHKEGSSTPTPAHPHHAHFPYAARAPQPKSSSKPTGPYTEENQDRQSLVLVDLSTPSKRKPRQSLACLQANTHTHTQNTSSGAPAIGSGPSPPPHKPHRLSARKKQCLDPTYT